MRAIWLHQPYPTLIELGVKEWETRGAPPNGPMRPDGVRGMPGLAIQPGERIAIVAAMAPIKAKAKVGRFEVWPADPPGRLHPNHEVERPCRIYDDQARGHLGWLDRGSWCPLPLGVVVCTAVVVEALPVVGPETDGYPVIEVEDGSLTVHYGPDYWGEAQEEDISDQLPYGDWRPGRWAWRLTDVEPVPSRPEPVVVRGNRQGVCEIEVLVEDGER